MTRNRVASPDEVIHGLQVALTKVDRYLDEVSDLMRMVAEDDQWHEFRSFTGATRRHDSFKAFVTSPRYEGLGTTPTRLLALLRLGDGQLAESIADHFTTDRK